MGFAGYVAFCVQLYCVGFHCLTPHVSANMAIFRCVGYFYFHCLKESALLFFFLPFLSRGHTLHVSICVFPVLFSFINFLFLACVFVCLLFLCCEAESFKQMNIKYPTHLKMKRRAPPPQLHVTFSPFRSSRQTGAAPKGIARSGI
jgi:membrane associated rhomboid family serine protease